MNRIIIMLVVVTLFEQTSFGAAEVFKCPDINKEFDFSADRHPKSGNLRLVYRPQKLLGWSPIELHVKATLPISDVSRMATTLTFHAPLKLYKNHHWVIQCTYDETGHYGSAVVNRFDLFTRLLLDAGLYKSCKQKGNAQVICQRK